MKYLFHSQLTIEEFKISFERNLSKENRWVKLSEMIPWNHFAVYYMKTMSSETERSGMSPQTVIGAIIIKHKLSDVETKPYVQFMLGLSEFQKKEEEVFDSSLFVTIRKNLPSTSKAKSR